MNELSKVEPNVQQTVTNLGNDDVLVIAEQPGQMQAAQEALIAWATAKVARVKQELDDAEECLAQATASGLKLHGVRKMVATARKGLVYYEKVKSALEEGYCIVPDFPVEIVAIRTNRLEPIGTAKQNWGVPGIEQKAQVLSEGEGAYVSPIPTAYHSHTIDTTNYEGKKDGTMKVWKASEFCDVDLPVKFMKPRVVEATNRAMMCAVFDEIGILPASPKKDPLVVGRIIDPKGRRLSFLISWFVDSRDL